MKLGMVTYQWGADWDLPTIFHNCKQTGYEGSSCARRTSTASKLRSIKQQRADVQKKFADAGIELVGLGSTCEFHSADPAVVKKNVELTKSSSCWRMTAAAAE